MLRCFGLTLLCGCFWLAGCHFSSPSSAAPNSSRAAPSQEQSADSIVLSTAFVQMPLGDAFLNPEHEQACLWSCTDHHVVNIEQQIVLEENGYRVGQVVGIIPARLMTLLNSKQTCIDPRRRILPCGEPMTLPLGPVLPRSTFLAKHGGQCQQFTLEQARFCLDVSASLTTDGRTRLEFSPKVEHRSTSLAVGVAADLSGLVNKLAPPHRSFPQLGWDVTLKPGETLVIGANLEKPDSLGCRSFVEADIAEPVQRVLVLRTSRPLEEP